MYSQEQASQIRQDFWKTFGRYMALHTSAEGVKINWINYKTGIRHLSFKMEADNKASCILIEMSHPDPGVQELLFAQFEALKNILNQALQETWDWKYQVPDGYGKTVSRISKCIADVSIFNRQDWPALISFLKPRIMALDVFWSSARAGFEMFQ